MKRGLIAAWTLAGLLTVSGLFVAGCGDDTSVARSPSESPDYLFRDVATVKFVNASQRVGTYLEVETGMSNILLLTTTTEAYLQTADFNGFDNVSLAPSLRSGCPIEAGQRVEYYYPMADVNHGRAKTEITVTKIYIYNKMYPIPLAVTEEAD